MKDAGTRKNGSRGVIEISSIQRLGSQKGHLLRKIDEAVDFNRLYEMVEPLYSEITGGPVWTLLCCSKWFLIQHLYGLPSLAADGG